MKHCLEGVCESTHFDIFCTALCIFDGSMVSYMLFFLLVFHTGILYSEGFFYRIELCSMYFLDWFISFLIHSVRLLIVYVRCTHHRVQQQKPVITTARRRKKKPDNCYPFACTLDSNKLLSVLCENFVCMCNVHAIAPDQSTDRFIDV